VIDLHFHALPGVDDGPASMEQAIALLRGAEAAGTHTVVATPHLSAAYPHTRGEGVREGVLSLQAEADAAGIGVRIVPGAELEVMHCEVLGEDDLVGLRLGEGPYALVELPFSADARFAEMLLGMHADLQPVVLAHPERSRAFQEDDELLGRLVGQGMLAQVTAASIAGSFGSTVKRCAWSMLARGLVHVVASDAHDAVGRPPLLREPLEAAGLGELCGALCEDGPAAILAGERPAPAPPATLPSSGARRRLRWALRRR